MLKAINSTSDNEKVILSKSNKKDDNDILSDEIKAIIANEELPEFQIIVPKSLSKHHPIISKWNETNKNKTKLDMRAGKILTVLLIALEKRGFKVEQHEKYTDRIIIALEEEKLCISIREKLKRYKKEITEKDRKEGYYSNYEKWRTVDEKTGKLLLCIYTYGYGIVYREFLDSEKQTIEKMLNKVVAHIIKKLYLEKLNRLKWEDWRKERELERLEQQRQQELNELKILKRKELIEQSDNWIKANNIRAYVQAVVAAKTHSEELTKWSKWALQYANELDPIIEE